MRDRPGPRLTPLREGTTIALMGAVDVIFPLSPNATDAATDGSRRAPLSVITCMDPRVDPGALLPQREGTAFVIRNAGGLVTSDVLQSLELAQRIRGARDVMVIHQTDCAGLTERAPGEPVDEVLRRALNALLDAPDLVHDGTVRGFVLDVDRGGVREASPFWSAPGRTGTPRGRRAGRARARCAHVRQALRSARLRLASPSRLLQRHLPPPPARRIARRRVSIGRPRPGGRSSR